uniref:Uncharacterized protein n=1 Tax=Rhizophora mucronata TaxID=61149 RepID=A0A2P2QZ38_RHIMU
MHMHLNGWMLLILNKRIFIFISPRHGN